jgi:transposase
MIALSFSKAIIEGLQQELVKAHRLNNLRLYKLAQGLLWFSEGKSIKEIGRLLQVSAKTVWNWLRRFLVKGLGWLRGQHYQGRGRKAKLTGEQKQVLYERVVAGPEANGFACGVWNTSLIAELIWRRFGVRYQPRYLSSLLKKLGLSYQKARFITDRQDDEPYQRTRRRWVEQTWPGLLQQAKASEAVILFVDEVSFALWGSLSRTWAPRGQQPLVKTKGIRKGLKMFGAIDFQSGAFYYREALAYTLRAKSFKHLNAAGVPEAVVAQLRAMKNIRYPSQEAFTRALDEGLGAALRRQYHEPIMKAAEGAGKFTGASYIEFLMQLLEQIGAPIILIHDGAPYHRSQEVQQFQADHAERLTLESLPAFSPDYNPIEKLWKNTKKNATHLKYFTTFDELRASVLKAFREYLHDATHVIRVMKKLRTEAGLS